MLIAIQSILAAIVCGLLFVAWRRFRRHGTVALVVAAGLLIRAVAGQVIFWISYLELPFARKLYIGRGFWFYAYDAKRYFDAVGAATSRRGVAQAIFGIDAFDVSPGFRKIVTIVNALFGHVPTTALLLNLAAYLGTCAIIIALAGDRKRVAMIAVAGISFSPAMILWSTQLLKDVPFVFLLAAFFGVVAWWIRASHPVLATLAMLVVLCAIASVRWHVAGLLLVVSLPVLLVVAIRSRTPFRSLALLLAMLGVVYAGAIAFARPNLPPAVMAVVTTPQTGNAKRLPSVVADVMIGAQRAYDRLPASTAIQAGPVLREMSLPAARFIAGTAALLLPRPIANATGLVELRGGRGLWFFADTDTFVFDVFLVIAIVALLRAPRLPKWRNPLVWLVVLTTLMLGAVFIYTVGNFGALFRYRSMVFLGVVLIPVVATWTRERRSI